MCRQNWNICVDRIGIYVSTELEYICRQNRNICVDRNGIYVSTELEKGSGWNICVDRIQNSQFKVALTRFTATLSSSCVKHNETSRF